MKIKHVVTSVALSLALGFGAVAGLVANKEAKAAKADSPKTWMMAISLNMSEPDTWGSTLSDLQVVVKVDGSESWYHMHETGVEHWWTVNISFTDSQEVTEYGFGFTQEGQGWKASNFVSTSQSKASHVQHLARTTVGMTWTDGKWDSQNVSGVGTGEDLLYTFDPTGASSGSIKMEEEPAKNRFIAKNLEALTAWDYNFDIDFASLDLYKMVKDSSKSYLSTYADTWIQFKEVGNYDVVLTNEHSDGGVFEIIPHEGPDASFIYYVLEDNVATNDYIYAWGGSEQFGVWPGTKITEVTGYKEVTGNGVLHFEGSETPKLIYRIPVTIGYPTGDSQFKFNNNNDWESDARNLVGGAAYWYTGAANADAGEAIDFLVNAEEYRNDAEDYSVCNISASDAAILVAFYNVLDADVRAYIDSSSVWTHKRDRSEGNELVSYRIVMEQLAELAKVSLVGSSRIFNSSIGENSTMIIVIVIASVSAFAFTTLLVFKKKKHK